MSKKGQEVKNKGLYMKMTLKQRTRVYETAKRFGLSASDFVIAVTDDSVVDAIENKIRQNFNVKTTAKMVV